MEAFCELFFDNLATLLGVTSSASYVGGIVGGFRADAYKATAIMSEWMKIYFEWHIPACGIGLLFGNVWFAWLATRLATKENRLDVTAQPYGMNTTVIFITLFAISLPGLFAGKAKYNDESATDPAGAGKKAAEFGWKVSVGVNFIIGFMEILGCFLGDIIGNTSPPPVFTPLSRASASSGLRSPP